MRYFFMTQVLPRNSPYSAPSSNLGCTYIHLELKDVEYFPARDFCLGAKSSKGLSKEY